MIEKLLNAMASNIGAKWTQNNFGTIDDGEIFNYLIRLELSKLTQIHMI